MHDRGQNYCEVGSFRTDLDDTWSFWPASPRRGCLLHSLASSAPEIHVSSSPGHSNIEHHRDIEQRQYNLQTTTFHASPLLKKSKFFSPNAINISVVPTLFAGRCQQRFPAHQRGRGPTQPHTLWACSRGTLSICASCRCFATALIGGRPAMPWPSKAVWPASNTCPLPGPRLAAAHGQRRSWSLAQAPL